MVDLNQHLREASSECFFQISSTRGSIALTLKTSHNFSPQGSPQLLLLHLSWSIQLRPRVHYRDYLEVSGVAALISASFFRHSLSLLWTCPNHLISVVSPYLKSDKKTNYIFKKNQTFPTLYFLWASTICSLACRWRVVANGDLKVKLLVKILVLLSVYTIWSFMGPFLLHCWTPHWSWLAASLACELITEQPWRDSAPSYPPLFIHYLQDTPAEMSLGAHFDVTTHSFDGQGLLNDKHFPPAKLILICICRGTLRYLAQAAGLVPQQSAHYFPVKVTGI